MMLLDAYAVVAFIANELAATPVERLLLEHSCAVSVVNMAEVLDTLTRVRGHTFGEAQDAWKGLVASGVLAVAVDEEIAHHAAHLRTRYYQRRHCEVSLADCVALATAIKLRASLATSDPPLIRVARQEGVRVEALPNTEGVILEETPAAPHAVI